jgi:hypothetical protein
MTQKLLPSENVTADLFQKHPDKLKNGGTPPKNFNFFGRGYWKSKKKDNRDLTINTGFIADSADKKPIFF